MLSARGEPALYRSGGTRTRVTGSRKVFTPFLNDVSLARLLSNTDLLGCAHSCKEKKKTPLGSGCAVSSGGFWKVRTEPAGRRPSDNRGWAAGCTGTLGWRAWASPPAVYQPQALGLVSSVLAPSQVCPCHCSADGYLPSVSLNSSGWKAGLQGVREIGKLRRREPSPRTAEKQGLPAMVCAMSQKG